VRIRGPQLADLAAAELLLPGDERRFGRHCSRTRS
jgi:hypothetical protein